MNAEVRYPREIAWRLKAYYYLSRLSNLIGTILLCNGMSKNWCEIYFVVGTMVLWIQWQRRVVRGKGKLGREHFDYSWLLNRRFGLRPLKIYCRIKFVDFFRFCNGERWFVFGCDSSFAALVLFNGLLGNSLFS